MVKSGPPDQHACGSGAFFCVFLPHAVPEHGGVVMDRKEMVYAKQALCGVKDWDAFQAVIRHWSKLMKHDAAAGWSSREKKS